MKKEPLENSVGPEDSLTPTDNADALAEELEALKAEAARSQDLLARSIADLDNFRKRVAREKEDLQKYRAEALAKSLLPILDNYKNGIKAAQQHEGAEDVAEGFSIILGQLMQVLKEQGVEEINPVNDPFDPHAHDCLSQTPSDTHPEGSIIEVIRPGYKLHDRLLRPATVVVSSGSLS